ncbi:MAG: hypothetical protein QXS45_01325 [Sulfolobales archaeon]
MPSIGKILFGSMPRTRSIARAISRYESGKVSKEILDESYRSSLKRFLDLAFSYDFARVSDGMYRWDDLFNPLASYLGAEVNGLRRFYDNNFFYRQPVFRKKIEYDKAHISTTLIEDLKILKQEHRIQRLSISLPGPLTLARNSIIEKSVYSSHLDLARDYVEKVVLRELETALREGVRNLDLHEPELGFEDLSEEYVNLYRRITDHMPGHIWIIVYFGYNPGNVRRLAEISSEKNMIPVIDLISSSVSVETFAEDARKSREVGVGIVDSRNTKIEKLEYLRDLISNIEKNLRDTERIYVTHNTNLEFLPERIAMRKIRLLGRVV